MPTPIRIRRSPPRHRVAGTFLLEALLALVVFSVGTLGILELIAGAQRESGNARWRSEAAALAASALARMWAEHPATLESRYGTSDGAGYRALRAAAQRLTSSIAALVGRRIDSGVRGTHSVRLRHSHE